MRLAQANPTVMLMMLCLLMIMPFSMLVYRNGSDLAPPYMGCRPTYGHMRLAGSMGVSREMVLSNYYLEKILGEARLYIVSTSLCLALLLFAGTMLVGVLL